jgi:hypothetical protein
MGAQEASLTLKTEGDKLTGKASGRAGEMAITDGKVSGNNAKFSMSVQQPFPMTLEYDLTVEGDKISGMVKAGSFGSFPATGVRA